MKQKKSILAVIFSLILSILFLSGELYAYKKSDLKKLESTNECLGCDLSKADLSYADLSRANLKGSNLSGADLSGADLSEADLSDADLSGADLKGAKLSEAILEGANLSGADLSDEADLSNANLSRANLKGSNLSGAYLKDANLSDADLSDADLSYADLSRANLKGADLKGADLSGANMMFIQIDKESISTNKISFEKNEEEERIAKKKAEQESVSVRGYKDIKFGMTYNQIKAAGICGYFAYADEYKANAFAESCYTIAGKKRHMMFYFTESNKQDLNVIHIQMGDSTKAYFNKLVKGIGKKYKETYRLTRDQQFSENKGDMIVFFADSRITLREFSNQVHLFYTREVSPLYTKFAPKDVSSDDF